jgi:hypothetical protein
MWLHSPYVVARSFIINGCCCELRLDSPGVMGNTASWEFSLQQPLPSCGPANSIDISTSVLKPFAAGSIDLAIFNWLMAGTLDSEW